MKKIVLFVLCCALLFSLVACGTKSPAETETKTETETSLPANPASDFEYDVLESGRGISLYRYLGTAENVVIPDEIDGFPVLVLDSRINEKQERIGTFENTPVKTVVIPNSVKLIGMNVFRNCKQLTSVVMSENCKYISSAAFENCEKLEYIDLSSSAIQLIESRVFAGCSSLSEVKFPDTLEEIGEEAFHHCSALTEVRLPPNLAKIGSFAFGNCTALKTVTIPAKLSLWVYKDSPFREVPSLEKVVFEEGRESIDGITFFDVTTDVEFIIPKSAKSFSTYTFVLQGPCRFVFLGDCPKSPEEFWEFYRKGEPTIYYDPDTKGWDTCPWKDMYPMKPLK